MTADEIERMLVADISKICDHPLRLSILEALAMTDGDAVDHEFVSVLGYCADIFADRNDEYQNLWRDGGPLDSLRHMQHKLARAERAKSAHTRIVSALDLINYAVFFILNTVEEELSDGDRAD